MAAIRRIGWRFRCERGAELIEFALTLPILLLVVLGIIEFGFVFREYEVVTNAVREGARIAVLPAYSLTDAEERVDSYLEASGLDPLDATAREVSASNVDLSGGACVQTFTATLQYPHEIAFIGGIASYFGGTFGTLTLAATSTMRSESAGACP
jgi:Flp pilus assembly protein TadG